LRIIARSCHGNDGSGDTEMDAGCIRGARHALPTTQNLSDAELFYIIENGVQADGHAQGWATGNKRKAKTSSWHLVHFIRHLPKLTEDEIARM